MSHHARGRGGGRNEHAAHQTRVDTHSKAPPTRHSRRTCICVVLVRREPHWDSRESGSGNLGEDLRQMLVKHAVVKNKVSPLAAASAVPPSVEVVAGVSSSTRSFVSTRAPSPGCLFPVRVSRCPCLTTRSLQTGVDPAVGASGERERHWQRRRRTSRGTVQSTELAALLLPFAWAAAAFRCIVRAWKRAVGDSVGEG